jgi:Chaperone of endosialidase
MQGFCPRISISTTGEIFSTLITKEIWRGAWARKLVPGAFFLSSATRVRRIGLTHRENTKGNTNMKSQNLILLLILAICVGLCSQMRAVVPAPDGGYPGGNTAEGQNALFSLTTGGFNTAVGYFSLRSDATGSFNTALGAGALFSNIGGQNTATGVGTLLSNTTGGYNTANGVFAMSVNTTGSNNTAIGSYALDNNSSGSFNTALGAEAGLNVTTASHVICIGSPGNDVDDSCFIGNIFGATSVNGVAVLVNSNGRLGTMTSSRRFKEEIKPMDHASEAVLALKPVTFRFKKEIDAVGTSQFGLVAEDVEKVNPDLVVRDKAGKPYSVRYDQVNAMLLNEFLKEHRKVEKLEATVADLAAELRQVKAQVQTNSPILRVAAANP